MNKVQCKKHMDAVTRICMGQGCSHRLMCQECMSETEHKYHGRYINFNLWESIRNRKFHYEQHQLNRLDALINFIHKKFLIEINRLRSNIEKEILVRLRTQFVEVKDHSVLSYISQIENNNYTDLDEIMIEKVRNAIEDGPAYSHQLETISPKQLEYIGKVVSDAFYELRLVEKIYWEHQLSQDIKPNTKEPVEKWNLFKSLNLNQTTSIDKYKKEEEICNKTISQSIIIQNGSQEFIPKSKSLLTGSALSNLLRSDRVSWSEMSSLNLSSCNITLLDPFIQFTELNLKRIDLSKNAISTVQPLTKVLMPNLEVILLSKNKIYTVQPLSRAKWPKLKLLDLSSNQITQLQSVVDWDFPLMQTLILSYNKINSIRAFTIVKWHFINKIEIKGIKLSGNEAIEKLCFADESLKKKFWSIF